MENNGTVAVFEDPLPATVGHYDLVGPSADRLYSLTIRRSTFSNNRARGLLLFTSNVLVEDVVIDSPSMECVMAEPDGCQWLEGAVASNVTFRNVTLRGCGHGHYTAPNDGSSIDSSSSSSRSSSSIGINVEAPATVTANVAGERIEHTASIFIGECVPTWDQNGVPGFNGTPYLGGGAKVFTNWTIEGCTFDLAAGRTAVHAISLSGMAFKDNTVTGGAGKPFVFLNSDDCAFGDNRCGQSQCPSVAPNDCN